MRLGLRIFFAVLTGSAAHFTATAKHFFWFYFFFKKNYLTDCFSQE